jgi:replicative DNA helicase
VLDPERTLLGAVLSDASVLSAVEGTLRAEHFEAGPHRLIYAAFLAMAQGGRSIDLVTAKDELGGAVDAAYLAGLVDGLPRITNVGEYARIIRERNRLRSLQSIGRRLAAEAASEGADAGALLDRLQTAAARLSDSEDHGFQRMGDLLRPAMAQIDAMVASQDGLVGIPTGIADFDRLTGGMKRGELWIGGACPGRGKSALLLQCAIHAASKGWGVLVFSMEMPPVSMVRRALFQQSGVDRWDLRRKDSRGESAWGDLRAAEQVLSSLPIHFDRRPSPTVAQIRAASRQFAQRFDLGLIVVDYLQRCSLPEGGEEQRWAAVGDIAKNLKTLAQSLDVPVFAACQLRMDAALRRPGLGTSRRRAR